MQKKFLGNLLLLQLLNFIVKPVWILLIDREVQNVLGEEIYGNYFVIFSFCLLFIILMDLGINNYNSKEVAADSGFIKAHRSKLIGMKLLLSLLYMALVIFVGVWQNKDIVLLSILGSNQVLLSLVQYFRSNLAGQQLFVKDAILSVLDKFVAIIICAGILFSSQMNITLFALAQTMGLLSALLVGVALNLKAPDQTKETTELSFLRLFRKTFPYAILVALMGIYTRIDAVMIGSLLDRADFHAGIYAQSFRLLDAGLIFAILLSGMLLPIFSRMITENKAVIKMVSLSAKIVLLPAVFVGLAAVLYGPYILDALYDFDDSGTRLYSSVVFAELLIAFIPMCSIYIYGTLLTAADKIKRLNIFAVVCVVLNISLNYILIPKYQAEGASLATLLTQLLFAALCYLQCKSTFNLSIEWKYLLKLIFLLAILFFSFYWLVNLNYSMGFNFIVYIAMATIFTLLLKLVDLKSAINMVKSKE
jgi:O-antigen/teichoic acid export membrane protein